MNNQKRGNVFKKIILSILGVLGVLLLAIVMFLVSVSPGKLKPLTDANGRVIENSISEKVKMEIGGINQGMFIVGENISNPVLLFLHGGPGSPEYPLNSAAFRELEKEFIVCYWDQRGTGMSYNKNIDPKTMTPTVMADDAIEVTNYLRKRFQKEKIFLFGHSWGSFLGVKVAEKSPDLFYAYVGAGQVSNQQQSEMLSYNYMLNHAIEVNDLKAVEDLKKYNVNDASFTTTSYIISDRATYLNKYGLGVAYENGTKKNEEYYTNLLLFRGYTISDKIGHIRGMMLSLNNTFPFTLKDSLIISSTKFELPVFFMIGKRDYTTSNTLAKEYFDNLEAPTKEFYSFEKSAHCPFNDEPEKFISLIKDIKDRYY